MKKYPIGARVTARWNDEGYPTLPFPSYISFGDYDDAEHTDTYGVDDDSILYYVNDESELRSLMKPTSNADDFMVLDYELVYRKD